MPTPRLLALPLLLALASASAAVAEEPPEAESEEASPAEEPEEGSDAASLPTVNLYLPEGDFDFRLHQTVSNAHLEGQVRYNFVRGDISALLRYKYYGYGRTYMIGVFDSLEFEGVEDVGGDFVRIRGGLLLTQWPHRFHSRSSLLLQVDRFTSNREELRFTTNRTNTYLRFAYQLGTPEDERSNAILGDPRSKIDRLFSSHRRIGPRGSGFTIAATYGFDTLGGDFRYGKLEAEALRRFELPGKLFLIGRIHAGTFPYTRTIREDPELPTFETISVPRTELFRLDGRDSLRGLGDALRGTEEMHTTVELFLPWFEDEERRFLGLPWTNFYWILYGGYGTIGFSGDVYTDFSSYYPDVGLGFESSFRVRSYTLFLSTLLAQALRGDQDPELRFSIKSYR